MQRKWRRKWERYSVQVAPGQAVTSRLQVGVAAKKIIKCLMPPLAAGMVLFCMTGAYANPSGGTVTSGSGTISQTDTTTTVTQTSSKLSINWDSFNVAANESVTFVQPTSTSVCVNRITGTDASTIYGSITANGIIYLINPNGILFGSSAQVNVGSLVASTLDISDDNLENGKYVFSGSGGSVVNKGTITATNGGYVALLGNQVTNDGVIVAKKGTVALAAGNQVTLDFDGDSLISLSVDTSCASALAANNNLIEANGGLVVMTAKSADTLAGTVVNNTGIIRAESVDSTTGTILLDGGANGTVSNSGTLDASGTSSGQTGGTVKVLGETVTLNDGSYINVSGDAGGGTALIGGNTQGRGTEQNATTTTVASTAVINANAITSGDGGKVVVWSDGTTTYKGNITATGGSVSGDGGNAEVSGKTKLVYDGTTDLTAANGTTGTLLLDPTNFIIAEDYGDMTPEDLATALETANITILSSNGATGTNGNIYVYDDISWTGSNTLTLSAYNSIIINASITNMGGGSLVLLADNTLSSSIYGTVTISSGNTISLSGGSGTATIYYHPSGYTTTDYSSYFASGTTYNAYLMVNDATDLQNMSENLSGTYALMQNIDCSSISSFTPIGTSSSSAFTGKLYGFGHTISDLTITDTTTAYAGLFGYTSGATISNLILDNVTVTGSYTSGTYTGALAGYAASSTISNVSVTGSSSTSTTTGTNITGNYSTGGLVGYAYSSTISDCAVTDSTVTWTGTGYSNSGAGGLIGWQQYGTTSNSYSTATVKGNGTSTGYGLGGLVGVLKSGTISQCYASGSVSGTYGYGVGGLVGWGSGTITNSYATGAVKGYARVGGFIGQDDGATITNCYATGTVSTSSSSTSTHGGFTGYVNSTSAQYTNSYWLTSNNTTITSSVGSYGKTNSNTTLTSITSTSSIASFSSSIWDTSSYTLLSCGPTITTTNITPTGATEPTSSGESLLASLPHTSTRKLSANWSWGITTAEQSDADSGVTSDSKTMDAAGVAAQSTTGKEAASSTTIKVIGTGVNVDQSQADAQTDKSKTGK
ncbi:MAG: hxuA 2 [Firmicutes bacterium]|nr:hxuA 2 [Bacillota bacterium]